MPKRQKYENYARTTISTDQWRLDAVKIIKKYNPHITETYIFNAGFDQVFETLKGQGRAKSVLINKVIQAKLDEFEELKSDLQELSRLNNDPNVCKEHTLKTRGEIGSINTPLFEAMYDFGRVRDILDEHLTDEEVIGYKSAYDAKERAGSDIMPIITDIVEIMKDRDTEKIPIIDQVLKNPQGKWDIINYLVDAVKERGSA